MGMPRVLKGFNLFHNAVNFTCQTKEITLPKLSRKMEEYQGGGMSGPIQIDYGQEAIQLEWTCAGFVRDVIAQYGITKHDGVLLRFAGGYQAEDTDAFDSVEIVVKGRHKEIDLGSAKAREQSDFKVTTVASYYKLSVNGEELLEFDFVNMVERINGNDVLAGLRKAIGL
ncbi:phage major tail tube protein [Robbsia andropogonis]|uniref:phage major tail tube protein n=1 Tax=Robbsia andropogonis TaxID=28092 RepID=UPI0020A089FC|nr:phage major tail tube protein [Robbsia andropogonis]MCP1116936.1 phage major tail tube protein [Robbsia andropogonis]MCP1126385.1 phage major tail tube protein [Robbsia andropogonis]